MKNVVLKNITDRADRVANLYNKTKDLRYKKLWYKIISQASGSGLQTNRIKIPCSLTSERPISSNLRIDSSYPNIKQS